MNGLTSPTMPPLWSPIQEASGRTPLWLAVSNAIAALFTSGEQGAWYDPSDLSTMWQDSAGTTPAAVNQPVGYIADKRLGQGAELASNGTFDANITPWTSVAPAQALASWDAGRLKLANVSGAANSGQTARYAFPTVVGKTYHVTAALEVNNDARLRAYGSGNPTFFTSGAGNYSASVVFVATATTTNIDLDLATSGAWLGAGTIAWLDNFSVRELPGNHATQATTANKPVLSARVNLLSNSRSANSGTLVNATAVPQPEGGFKLVENVDVTRGRLQFPAAVGGANTITVWARSGEWNRLVLGITNGSGVWSVARFNLDTGEYEGRTDYSSDRVKNPVIVREGDFWRCSVSRDVGTSGFVVMPFGQGGDPINPNPAMVGDGTSGIYIERMQVEYSPELTRYQDSRTATDYDSVGFPHYLQFDGVDDFLQTGSIDFTATDKMTVWAGVRKLSDAKTGYLVELGAGGQTESFWMTAPVTDGGATFGFLSRGSLAVGSAVASGFSSPTSAVLSATGDISGDVTRIRANGGAWNQNTSDQGTGNYRNGPIYIGRRAGSVGPFNGHIYSLIVRGAASDAGQIADAETHVANKTGVTLP